MKAYNNAVARLLQSYSRLQTRSDMNTTTEDTMGSSVGRLSEIPLVFSNRIDHAFHRGEPRAHAHVRGRSHHVPRRARGSSVDASRRRWRHSERSPPRNLRCFTFGLQLFSPPASNYPLILSCHFLHSFTADRSDLTSKSTGGGALLNPRTSYELQRAACYGLRAALSREIYGSWNDLTRLSFNLDWRLLLKPYTRMKMNAPSTLMRANRIFIHGITKLHVYETYQHK